MKTIKMLLSCLLILISTVTIAQEKQGKEENESEMEVTDFYFVNSEDERIEDATISDKFVYLVIETKNGIGEEVNIEMDDQEDEFIYENKYLTIHDKITFVIKKDRQRTRLEIYDPSNEKHQKLKEEALERQNKTISPE
ncbi:hypothetical protein [Aquimarina sp. AU58]|uniref:hypothetical protein n=1 Tax=Aquimarina sp. AU58 TaxID=1874112 RepID=UPI001357D275|nr:hypothetical protein [Aquimarina sp. AU58]